MTTFHSFQKGKACMQTRKRHFTLAFTLLVVSALLLSACQPIQALPAAAINDVSFEAQDGSYRGPDSIPAGLTRVQIVNAGQELHHIQLVQLTNGKTIDELSTAYREHPDQTPTWMRAFGGPNAVMPGASASAIVNLAAGDYFLTDIIPDGSGVLHLANGMWQALTVTAAAGQANEPPVDGAITLGDFSFALPETPTAGEHTLRVENGGKQQHEVVLVKLQEGVDVMQFLQSLQSGSPLGAFIGGISPIEPGIHGFFTQTFTPGNYALLCFLPDNASHALHVAKGMVVQFTVK
jgi:uncharacterized cupredoxin-like copper-binding protein